MEAGEGPQVDAVKVAPVCLSMEARGGLELVLVWWPLPECSWRLEVRLVDSVLVVIAGVHGCWRGPRVGAGLVATAGVFMETGGASS